MATTLAPPRLLPSGDSAITVEFARNIDDAANQRVLALDRAMAARPVMGVTETVPTYRSLLVHYDPVQIGFEALGEKLMALARRQNPRLLTPAGTISIGGVQTGIQCLAGPSGWHLLGRTPVRTYQLHRDPIFLLEPGDGITFVPIDAKTFAEQDRAAEAGEIVAELIAA
jgi:allophanate hydrolase subunit 1